MFSNPKEAVEAIGTAKPDVVFLDINMPQLRGTDAASMILERSPDTDIVFVTAFDEYAVEAFELNALDYILKPANAGRLAKTVERINRKRSLPPQKDSTPLQIRCLGRFEILHEKQEPVKWRAEKTKELFAFLLFNEGRVLQKEELLDALWPDDPIEKSMRQLYNGIYYIRKMLKDHEIDRDSINIDGNYCMKLGSVDCDAIRFRGFESRLSACDLEELKEMERLYVGDYLGGEYYEWANAERERMLSSYCHCLIALSEKLLKQNNWYEAEAYLTKAYAKNPYDERTSELLIKALCGSGNVEKALRHYNEYADLISHDLGISPSQHMDDFIIHG